jgi:hypothetical protein
LSGCYGREEGFDRWLGRAAGKDKPMASIRDISSEQASGKAMVAPGINPFRCCRPWVGREKKSKPSPCSHAKPAVHGWAKICLPVIPTSVLAERMHMIGYDQGR